MPKRVKNLLYNIIEYNRAIWKLTKWDNCHHLLDSSNVFNKVHEQFEERQKNKCRRTQIVQYKSFVLKKQLENKFVNFYT